jgi:hypothetical protein
MAVVFFTFLHSVALVSERYMKVAFYLFALAFSLNIQAQTLSESKEFTAGDKLTFQTKGPGKSSKYEFIFTEVNSSMVKGTTCIDDKQTEFGSPSHGYLGKEFCLADVMGCEWTPPVKLIEKILNLAINGLSLQI